MRSNWLARIYSAQLPLSLDVVMLLRSGQWKVCKVNVFNYKVTPHSRRDMALCHSSPKPPRITQMKAPRILKLRSAVSSNFGSPWYTANSKSQHTPPRETVLFFNKLVITRLSLLLLNSGCALSFIHKLSIMQNQFVSRPQKITVHTNADQGA